MSMNLRWVSVFAVSLFTAPVFAAAKPAPAAVIKVAGTPIDLQDATVHRATTPRRERFGGTTPPKTVTVDTQRGLSIQMPSRAFGRGLSKGIASSRTGAQRDTLLSAAAKAQRPVSSESHRDRPRVGDSAREEYEDKHSNEDVGALLGLPYEKWQNVPGKKDTYHSVPQPGRRASGPLTASKKDPNLVEGSWTVGKSNGSKLRALVSYLIGSGSNTKPLTRGERIGLRASPAGKDYDITIYRGTGKHAERLHYRTEVDEGWFASGLNADYAPASHKKAAPQ